MLNKFTKRLDLRVITATVTAVSVIGVISVSAMFDPSVKQVTVTEINDFSDENSTKKIRTKENSVGEFLNAHDYELGAHDILSLDEDAPISENTEITITRGMPFTIAADGNITMCSTTKTTVGEALLETGHYPDEDDIIYPDLSTQITENLTVSITRVDSENLVITEEIPNTTEYIEDNTLTKGKTKVVREGHPGAYEVVVKVVYNNGSEISREEISRVITREPENKIIANGTKPLPTPTPKATQKTKKSTAKTADVTNDTKQTSGLINGRSYKKKLSMTATGYSAFNSDGSKGKTASGRTAGYGLVAVDPSVIPLGTKLYIDGYGEAIAADTGSAIKGNKIDLCFEMTNAEIRKSFGKKTVSVYILE